MSRVIGKIEVVPAELFHAEQMAPNMRKADVDEIWASNRDTPLEALVRGVKASSKCWSVIYDDQVALMGGVAPGTILDRTGIPWALGTPLVEEFQFTFLRHSKEYVIEAASGYDTLVNYVDQRNTISIRWLKWLGFSIEQASPMGVFQIPFHRFEMRMVDNV